LQATNVDKAFQKLAQRAFAILQQGRKPHAFRRMHISAPVVAAALDGGRASRNFAPREISTMLHGICAPM